MQKTYAVDHGNDNFDPYANFTNHLVLLSLLRVEQAFASQPGC